MPQASQTKVKSFTSCDEPAFGSLSFARLQLNSCWHGFTASPTHQPTVPASCMSPQANQSTTSSDQSINQSTNQPITSPHQSTSQTSHLTSFLQVNTSRDRMGTALLSTARESTMSTRGSVRAMSLILPMSKPYTLSQKSICRATQNEGMR